MGCLNANGHQKAPLSLVSKFVWVLVRNKMSLTKDNKLVTWDRRVMVAALVEIEIDFTTLLLAEIYERVLKNPPPLTHSLVWHFQFQGILERVSNTVNNWCML